MVKEYSYSKDGNVRLSLHFTLSEFLSGDGADKVLVSEELIDVLEKLRSSLSCSKIKVNSGYRTSNNDIEVGGSGSGYHTKGMAADIQCYDMSGKIIDAKYVCMKAQDLNIHGIGYISYLATHIDVRDYIWYRDESKNYQVVNDWYDYFGETKIPFKIGDVITSDEDITLYSSIVNSDKTLLLNKNKKSIVRLIKGNYMCLGDDTIKYYYPAGWTNEYNKFKIYEEVINDDNNEVIPDKDIVIDDIISDSNINFIKKIIKYIIELFKKLFS